VLQVDFHTVDITMRDLRLTSNFKRSFMFYILTEGV
jgi:hypothetical protein